MILSAKDLEATLEKRERDLKDFVIECSCEDTTLFVYRNFRRSVEIFEDKHSDVLASFRRAGVLHLKCEYFTREVPTLNLKYDDISSKDWDEWFSKLTENRELILDTNLIINHTLSQVILPCFGFPITVRELPWRIMIPRLVILEIEAKFNRARNKSKDKRLMIYAQTEIQTLKLLTEARLLKPLSADLLSAYWTYAGKGVVDPFIRKEIIEYVGDPISLYRVSFLTEDLMNALAASAEDIDTFYFSLANPDLTEVQVENFLELAHMIVETAITFSEIKVKGLTKKYEEETVIQGMWPGKSHMHWYWGNVRQKV